MAATSAVRTLVVPAADDMHVHLRDGTMMKLVAPTVRRGGVRRAYVMPNLTPPITTAADAVAYRARLQAVAPDVDFLMTLYLNSALTPDEIRAAARAGVVGVKSYPKGVTTNSDGGIENYDLYDSVFAAMEQEGLVLNLHGEVPSDHSKNICVLNAEEQFLPHLEKIHRRFPKLRIVLEHTTTAAAVEKVKALGDTVAATITVHHLELTVDDWAGKVHNFCKPVAKFPADREALWRVVEQGHPRFFLGSDSAPHPRHLKECATACAGVFTSGHVLPYLATLFERRGCLERLGPFTSEFGARFYRLAPQTARVTLVRQPQTVPDTFAFNDGDGAVAVVPFWAGKELAWTLLDDGPASAS